MCGGSLVAGRLTLEPRPRLAVAAELALVLGPETGGGGLERVHARPLGNTAPEGGDTGRPHQPQLCQALDLRDIDVAPGAGRLSRRESDGVGVRTKTASDTVDPAEAQGLVHRLGPSQRRLACALLVEADEELALALVVFVEPGPELITGGEEDRLQRERSASGSSRAGEVGDAPGGVAADVGAHHGEDLGAVDRAHDLAAPGGDAGAQQQPVEVDALVAERVALIDADDRRYRAAQVVLGGEAGPGQRVAGLELLDPVGHGAPVVVQIEKDAVVLARRRVLG